MPAPIQAEGVVRDCQHAPSHDHGTLHGYTSDRCRCLRCRAASRARTASIRRLQAYGRDDRFVDPAGSRRRLDALAVCGYSRRYVADVLGVNIKTIHAVFRVQRMTRAKAERIEAVYVAHWDKSPRLRSEYARRSAAHTRRRARARGAAPAMAWDNIDDPTEIPAGAYVPRAVRPSDDVAAEYEHLHDYCGLSDADVAAALGMTEDGLRHALDRREARLAA